MIIIVTICSINSQIGDCEKRILPASVRNVTVNRIGNGMCEDQRRYRERNQSSHACHKTTCVSPKFSITLHSGVMKQMQGGTEKSRKTSREAEKSSRETRKKEQNNPAPRSAPGEVQPQQYSVALIVLSRPICCVSGATSHGGRLGFSQYGTTLPILSQARKVDHHEKKQSCARVPQQQQQQQRLSAGIIIPLNIIQATSSTRGNEKGERVERQKKSQKEGRWQLQANMKLQHVYSFNFSYFLILLCDK